MKTKRIVVALIMIGLLAALGTGVGAQSSPKDCLFCQRIIGTWEVLITTDDGFQLKERVTFMADGTDSEGPLISTNELDSFACGTAQGVWVRTGVRPYATTHTFYCFNTETTPPGEPAGSRRLRDVITLSENGHEFTGRFKYDVFDLEGHRLGGAEGTLQGTRLRVEPIE